MQKPICTSANSWNFIYRYLYTYRLPSYKYMIYNRHSQNVVMIGSKLPYFFCEQPLAVECCLYGISMEVQTKCA